MAPNQKLEGGDLIKISRGGYQHWAVYIGDGLVVHIVKPGIGQAIVKKEKLMDVVGDHHGYSVHNYLDDKYIPRDPSEIIKEALSHVGKELPYNLLTQNCEHFATDMRYGKPECRQVLQAGIIAASVLFVMTIGVSAVIRSRRQKAAKEKAQKRCIRPSKTDVARPRQCTCERYPKIIVDYEPSMATSAENKEILYVDEQLTEKTAQYYTFK